jgi:hypothetical protein
MTYTPLSLGEIVQQAGAIKGQQQRSQLAGLQIQEAQKSQQDQQGIDSAVAANPNASLADLVKAGGGMAGVGASQKLTEAHLADLTAHYRQTYTAATQVANSDNPLATIQQVAPQFPQQFDSVHGQGAFAKFSQDPAAVKQQAAQVAQDALAGLVDPDKQFQAHQTMIENHYKQEGPGGELARNQNTIAAENTRSAAQRAVELQGQRVTLRGQNLADARDLKPVQDPMTGAVTYQPVAQAVGQPVGSAATGGGRIQATFPRVLAAGNEAAQTLHNLARLPSTANSGLFGIGKTTHGVLDTMKGALGNELSTQDTQRYNALISGMQRNLGSIEAAGLSPGESLTSSLSSVVLKPGDTEITKLTKMAEMRQIAEKGLETFADSPGVSPQQKQRIKTITAQLQTAVPYTQDDVTDLSNASNPKTTINDIVKLRGLGLPTQNGGTHGGAPITVSTPEEAMKLPPGTQFKTPDGRLKIR